MTEPISRRVWIASALLAGVAGRLAARAPQGQHRVYIGTYTGPSSRGIYTCLFDPSTGALTPPELAAETPSPSFLTLSADRRHLYAVNETSTFNGEGSGSVSAFAVDATNGGLTPINVQSARGAAPCHLALDHTGRYLAVANYTGGSFVVLPVDSDGRLGPVQASYRSGGRGPNHERQEGPHAHMVLFDATNRFLLGADLGVDRVLVFGFDAAAGAIGGEPAAFDLPPGSGPRHLAFHPIEPIVFGINELTSTISTFLWDGTTGRLERQGEESTLPPGYTDPSTTAEIAVHPSGRFLYASNRGHDSLACYGLSSDGQLAVIDYTPTRGRTPRHFTIDPSGRWLIVANQESDSLAVFAINDVTGRLSVVGPVVNVGAPVCVALR